MFLSRLNCSGVLFLTLSNFYSERRECLFYRLRQTKHQQLKQYIHLIYSQLSMKYKKRIQINFFYISFAAQISDLSLQVFIPLNRLVFPQSNAIAPRISFLKHCYEDSLEHFEKSQDLIRLESILRILEGG